MIGQQIGPYAVLSRLGEGGMGEVYRARDTTLGRDVALKILPENVATDRDRLARFQREAQVLAALNHPNIGAIYGVEGLGEAASDEGGGPTTSVALVLELVEGEDLSERIARGAIPIADALPIARQVADALEAAHDHGVIHRDLKPANIKVRDDGTVKVLDFGLAKALLPESGSGVHDATQSPTLTARATQLGMVLGTAAYMAPEQARGKAVDRRADVWAFGVVLYEMLTGRRAFDGDDASDVLAAVLRQDLDWSALPANTPEPIRRLLRRCLEKDRRERLADMSAARIEIKEALAGGPAALPTASTRPRTRVTPAVALAAFAFAVTAAAAAWFLKPDPVPPTDRVVQFPVPLPAGSVWTRVGSRVVAISPDGTRVAYIADQKLFVRPLAEIEPLQISSVADPAAVFFSPDGQWLGFWSSSNLMKVAVSGGGTASITAASPPSGAHWIGDTIVFGQDRGLLRVSANGGTPELVVETRDNERLASPSLVMGGRSLLFARAAGTASWDDAEIVVEDLASHERRTLIRGGKDPTFIAPNHLVYGRAGELLGVALDPVTLEPTGTPVRLLEGVSSTVAGGLNRQLNYSVSANGTLAFVVGQSSGRRQLFWADFDGRQQLVTPDPGNYLYLRLSPPDGARLAYADAGPGGNDIFILEWSRNRQTKLTTFAGEDTSPLWTPDGSRVVFSSSRAGGGQNLYWQAADGTGTADPLTTGPSGKRANAWTPDGRTLLYGEVDPATSWNIFALDVPGDGKPRPLVVTPFDERRPDLSRDGRWMAYQSNESGSPEIYVRPYPNVEAAKHPISVGGGMSPLWAPDGRVIYYQQRDRIYRVSVATTPVFKAGTPEPVLDGLYPAAEGMTYALMPDSSRFVVIKPVAAKSNAPEYRVIVNWIEDVKARVRSADPSRRDGDSR